MILFPLIYISAFIFALKEIIRGNRQAALLFLIIGLPIYTISLSVLYNVGLKDLIVFLQPFKEIIILSLVGTSIWHLKTRIRFHAVDYAVIAFFLYSLLYVFLPVGEFGFASKLLAFKSTTFFTLIYTAGRLFNPREIYISKYFHYILIVAIAAGVVVVGEMIFYQHLQTLTGYADYNYYFFNQESTGLYGLSWTFEIESGLKRFASFFSDPLEHAGATVLALAVIAGLYTRDNNQFKPDSIGKMALIATFVSILFALSRASLASYFMVVYVYAWRFNKKYILHLFHLGFIACVLYFLFLIQNDDLYDFVISTITFESASSIGHIVEWLDGINAMIQKPLGLGLGHSGRVATDTGVNVGGENTFIIIGVQTGVIAMLLYMYIQVSLIRYPYKWIKRLKGKERSVAIALFLIKIGSIVSLLTTNLEVHSYVNYLSWFLCGLFINIIMSKEPVQPQEKIIANADPVLES